MKYIATVVVFATVFVLGIVPKARAGENEACSNATLHGSFGYTSTGTLLDTYVPSLLRVLSLRSVSRPSTETAILMQPRL
jgi:hypothetical protein